MFARTFWERESNLPSPEVFDAYLNTKLPCEFRFYGPIALNDKEFFIIPYMSHYWRASGLYKYNTDNRKWQQWIKYPDNIRTSFHTAAFDQTNQLLYIYGKEALLIIINLRNKETIIKKVRSVGKYAASVIINGAFHLIGGFRSNKHLLWNPTLEAFDEVFHFKEWGIGYYLHKLCYIESKQLLLTLGGYTTSSRSTRSTDLIYIYDIKRNKWHRSSVSMPRRMYSFGFILTPNEKHIIIFGGNSTNHIHICDTMTLQMVKLDIECPINGTFTACVTGNHMYDGYVVSEFVKNQWKLSHYRGVTPLSFDLLKMLQRWYSTEEIHLINSTKKEHWKINLAVVIDEYHKVMKEKEEEFLLLKCYTLNATCHPCSVLL